MARIIEVKEPSPLNIRQFLGLNLATTGDTQLTLGESGNMRNCIITDDYNLSKALGYDQLSEMITDKPIRGMWHGYINKKLHFLFAVDGKLYRFNDNYWLDHDRNSNINDVATIIGNLTDSPTQFFSFSNKVYILNGFEYKSYDGSEFTDVFGYTPKINIGCNPETGTGEPFESLNLLNGTRHQTYHGNGKTKIYKIIEKNINSVDKVYVNGTLLSTSQYTTSLGAGTVTFTSTPSEGLNNVDIYWTKGNGYRSEVEKMRFPFLFGTAEDTRVFLYGNTDAQNKRVFSSLANGIPSVEYFIATSVEDCGSSATPITGMERQQSRFLIHKTNESYYSYYDVVNIDGVDIVNFPMFSINEKRGNIPMGQGQVLDNEPFTIDSGGFIKWIPTDIKDERNVKDQGRRIQKDLNNISLENCLTIDKENTKELYISNGKTVWIYKYDLYNSTTKEKGVFSKLILDHEPTCWLEIGNSLYFGTTNGKIMKFDDKYLTYNGEKIDCRWEMNMYDFGANWLRKTLNKSWLTLTPKPKSSVKIQFITDKNAYGTPYVINYDVATFDVVDFSNFSFYTNFNPQAFYVRLKAKKFVYLKLVIDNDEIDSTFTITNITLKAEYGNEIK